MQVNLYIQLYNEYGQGREFGESVNHNWCVWCTLCKIATRQVEAGLNALMSEK